MMYARFWMALASVGAVALGACVTPESAQEGQVSGPGGFAAPEQRLAARGADEGYCSAEVLRWQYDRASGVLKIADSRLMLNCCGQRSIHVERLDGIYEITEKDEPEAADRRCDAVCAFDFAASIPEVTTPKVFVRLLRDVTDAQGSAELIWQGSLDLRAASGEVVLDDAAAPADACGGSAQ